MSCAYKRQDRQGVNLVAKQGILEIESRYTTMVEVNQGIE